MRIGAEAISFGGIRVQPNGLCQICDGTLEVAKPPIGPPARYEGFSEIWVLADSGVEIPYRGRIVVQALMDEPSVVIVARIAGTQADGLTIVLDRELIILQTVMGTGACGDQFGAVIIARTLGIVDQLGAGRQGFFRRSMI